MKTCSLYGFISALASAILGLVLFFAGYHSDPAKLSVAQSIGTWLGLLIFVVCLVLAIKTRRAETPLSEPFGYGSALWAGTLMTFVSALLSAIFNFFYLKFINPGFAEIVMQVQDEKLQAKGISGPALERAENITRMMLNPPVASVFNLFFLFIIGFLIALVVAAFITRPEPAAAPAA